MFNIVDSNGNKGGFATMPEKLMERVMKHGARWFPNSELISINKTMAGSPSHLTFKSGITSIAKEVILNMPQRPLISVIRKSTLPPGAVNANLFSALHAVQTEIVTKLYMHYSDAWWRKLNLTVGSFDQTGDTQNMLLEGRYHDGHVNCDKTTGACQGGEAMQRNAHKIPEERFLLFFVFHHLKILNFRPQFLNFPKKL